MTNKPKNRPHVAVTLEGLNRKLDFETKRLVREREEGIVKYVSKTAVLNGNSTLVFKNGAGSKITLSYRLDKDGNLRFSREKRFTIPADEKTRPAAAQHGGSSKDLS